MKRFYVSKLRLTEGEGTATVQRLDVVAVDAASGQAAIDAVKRECEWASLPGEVFSAAPIRPNDWHREIERVWVAS